jgi:hypothetical protein
MSTQPFIGTVTEAQRLKIEAAVHKAATKAAVYGLRVAMPGIIQSFDPVKQTVTVQLAITDQIKLNGVISNQVIPILPDVPIIIPRGGAVSLTLPIQQGDECLVILADMCIDAWFDSGKVSNQQKLRRHDLSDGFAILGPWSQPRVLEAFSQTQAQLRNDTNGPADVAVSVGATEASIAAGATSVEVDGTHVTLTGLLALSGAPVASATSATLSFPVKIGSVTYYLKLSATP